MTMKYIVFTDEGLGLETPIIFPIWLNHRDVAVRLGLTVEKIVSAGFFNGNKCYGNSHSLDIPSREQDSLLITDIMV